MPPFIYSNTNKRYHTYNYFLTQKFGGKVAKISLDAGFTCPNIDGAKGVGGCTFCSSRGSGDFAGSPDCSLEQQFQQGKSLRQAKWGQVKYIPYLQAHTNTYAPLAQLKQVYRQAMALPGAVGLSIATRADCISQETADYLQALSRETYLEVELGLQSIFDETGRKVNRCHTYDDFLKGFSMLRQRDIPVCIHIINGLPGETKEMMKATARAVGQLGAHSIKIHLLHVLQGTAIAQQLERGEFSLLSREEYVDIVCDQLELLPPEMVVQRLTGDGDKSILVGPMWSTDKRRVLNEIDKELVRRDSWQGKKLLVQE